jgi:hypothetical protein
MSSFRALALACLVSACLPGCDEAVTDIIGDDHTDPGGQLVTQLDSYPSVTLTALGSGDPFTVTATSSTFVVAITCGPDAIGDTTKTALSAVGGSVTLDVGTAGPTELQVHANGTSCIGDSGLVSLTTVSTNSISGQFEASGHLASDNSHCTITGTVTNVPVSE